MPEQQSVSPLYAAVLARCPRCGKGRLFKNLLEMRQECDRCDLDYRFIDTGDGPAVFAIFILGFLICGLALYVEFTYEPAVWVHVVLWGAADAAHCHRALALHQVDAHCPAVPPQGRRRTHRS